MSGVMTIRMGVKSDRSPTWRTIWAEKLVAILVALAVTLTVCVAAPPVALADTSPANPSDPATPVTVSADPLPTVQIDGVVWQQIVVGNTVYAAGDFGTARPAGAAIGTNTVVRNNILAYDIRTGELIDSFAPSLNAQALSIAASPDGRRIYVGGTFTEVNGASVWRVAALDAITGQLLTNFVPKMAASVRALVVTDDTVYMGGAFTAVGGVSRSRLAAFDVSDGSLKPWAPEANSGQVTALAISPDHAKIMIGGSFTTLNGSSRPGYGLGAVDAVTAQMFALPVNDIARNGGTSGSITSLSSDGTNVYGSGYTYGRSSTLEGIFSVKWSDLSTQWIEDCHGDTYSAFPIGDVVYAAGHAHYCGNIGGFPQEAPWDYHRAIAFSKSATGTITEEPHGYTNFEGNPSPSLLNWFPYILDGTFTGQNQGPWSVSGNSKYVVMGGEFPIVNGTAQQGLVRFAVKELAPNKRGPKLTGSLFNPTLKSDVSGDVRVRWQANWDEDNKNLTYQVLRDTIPVYTTKQESTFWDRPGMTFVDKGLVPGRQYGYRISATDPAGNVVKSDTVTVTVATTDAVPSTYETTVMADSPSNYWRLGEGTGPTGFDAAGSDDVAGLAGVSFGVDGAISGDANTAVRLNGTAFGIISDPSLAKRPNTFSTEAWIRTTTTSGGGIIGFGNASKTLSVDVDRQIYMDNLGRVWFGVAPRGIKRTVNSTRSFNDGQWHHIVATLGADGMALYVDGALMSTRTDAKAGRSFDGYWRVGGDNLNGWSSRPSSRYLQGEVDEVAIYSTALSSESVARHYSVGTTGEAVNLSPVAAFESSVAGLGVSVDGSGSVDTDGTVDSYAWDFGDGGKGSGVTASHTYEAAGTFPVKLTVTDDAGATHSVTHEVTVAQAPENTAPVAAFESSVAGLGVSVDGSGSVDTDGTVDSYAWDFGDGGKGSGVTASHTYEAAGTFPVKLTVTDDAGATHSVTHEVTVAQAPGDGVLAADTFGRTVSGGFGTAERGGAWTLNGSASLFSVANGNGSIQMSRAGAGPSTFLGAASTTSADTTVKMALDKVATGGGTFVTLVGRHVGTTGEYRAKVWVSSTGTVSLDITRAIGGTVTTLQSRSVAGLRYALGEQLQIRMQTVGTAPTTLNAKVWKVGEAEPSTWTATASDSAAEMQSPGYIGLSTYVSGSATNAPITASFDDLSMKTITPAQAPENTAPVAAFESSVAGLGVSVDGSGSVDTDGTVDSYAWDFGDGGKGSGVTASHTYEAAGTFPVKLTVTDDAGATHSVTHEVTVAQAPENTAPVAAFESSVAGLGVSVDGSGSVDTDGTVDSYAWDFGDGGKGSGVTASHTYEAAGTFPVKLTVTDDAGATHSVTHEVTVAQAPGDGVLAADTFGRTVSGGFGTAERGGAWTLNGSASLFSVANGNGSIQMKAAGTGPAVYLASVSSSNTETAVKVRWDKVANGGGSYTYVIGRRVGAAEYRGKVWISSNGTVTLAATKVVSGTLTTLATRTVQGMTYQADDQLQIRLQVTGTSPTSVNAKVWKVGTSEPSTWAVTATDSEPELQTAGGIGLTTYLSGSATSAPIVASFDDLVVKTVP